MAVTPLPFLDRTSATFKTDTDTFFGSQLPTFSVQVNQVATDAQANANAANTSKNAAATSATNAANSATAANTSKTNAATSATNAATSATNAANSATDAASSATAANSSKTAAATSATNSEASAVRAKNAADSIASGPVTSVNGKTGAPVLNKADIGLPLADNVSVVASGLSRVSWAYIADIDDYTLTNGWYAVSGAAGVTAGTKPNTSSGYGILRVSGRNFSPTGTRVWQEFFHIETGDVSKHERVCQGGTWSAWDKTSLPSASGLARKPLTTGEASSTVREWSDILSIPKYVDKVITGTPAANLTLNLALATVFDLSLTANVTLALSNLPALDGSVSPTVAGESLTVIVRIRQNASPKTITWWSGITWLTSGGSVPPTPTASQIVEYIFSTSNAGTTWIGRVGAST